MATLSKDQTYLVYNTSSSPLCLSTRYDSFLLEGGTPEEPSALPLSLDEIVFINSKSSVFKIGAAWFDSEYEAAIYDMLRITNWRNILRDREIEDILLHPTIEQLQRIIDIDNITYFERVRGAYTGLKNIGAYMTTHVENLIKARYKELQNKQYTSTIQLVPRDIAPQAVPSQEVDDLKRQLAELQALVLKMSAGSTDSAEKVTAHAEPAEKPTEEKKPASKPVTKGKRAVAPPADAAEQQKD